MGKFNVYISGVVETMVPVDADSYEEAAERARDLVTFPILQDDHGEWTLGWWDTDALRVDGD